MTIRNDKITRKTRSSARKGISHFERLKEKRKRKNKTRYSLDFI